MNVFFSLYLIRIFESFIQSTYYLSSDLETYRTRGVAGTAEYLLGKNLHIDLSEKLILNES